MAQEAVTPAAKIIEHPTKQEGIFDHRTHIKNALTNRIIGYQPYATHQQGTMTLHERPIGSGNMFSPSGESAGRWAFDGKSWAKIAEVHAEIAPQEMTAEAQLEQENEALRKELAALKAEQTPKTTPTNSQKK